MAENEQTPEVSLEERIGAHFVADEPEEDEPEPEASDETEGVDEDEAQDEGEQPEEPEFAEIEFDGRQYQVPPELKDAFMRTSDYTQKTQKTAEIQRGLEIQQKALLEAQRSQEFVNSIQQEVSQLQIMDAHLQQQVNWDAMTSEEMFRKKIELDELQKQRNQIAESLEGKRQEFLKEREKRSEEVLAEGQEYLRKSINGWNEDLAKEVVGHAISDGYTSEEIASIHDPRYVKTLWKAMQYDKLLTGSKEAVKAAQKAPPVVKSGSVKKMPDDVKDKLNFRKKLAKARKEGSHASARVIEERLSGLFGG